MNHLLKYFGSYVSLGLLWLLHWLPMPLLRGLGWLIGHLLFVLAGERRRVVLTNLQLCFPDQTMFWRWNLARRNVVAFTQAFLDRAVLWWAPRERLARIIRVQGVEHLAALQGQPVIVLAPHFVGLDAGWSALTMRQTLQSVYSNQKNPVFNAVLLAGRSRFNAPVLVSRLDGLRKSLKLLRENLPLYYLPDMDFGRDGGGEFIPFFGVPAMTLTALGRMAGSSGAKVMPCLSRMVFGGYEVTLLPPWENFPVGETEQDTLRMNQFIESQVLTMPEQYFWLHKRFKTRPPGEPRIY